MKTIGTTKTNSPLLDILMELCSEIISVKSLDLKYLDCNRAFLDHLGLSEREEVIGKTIFEVLPKRNLDLIVKNIEQAILTKKPQSYSFKITTKDSSKIVQQISTPVCENNEIKYILTISRDITSEEAMKNELISKSNQLNTLMEHLPILVYMKDNERNYLTGSRNAKNFIENGIDPHADNLQIDIKSSEKETEEEDNFVLTQKEILIKEKTAMDLDGQQHWYNIVKAPIIKEDNSIEGLITIARNIDPQKALENQKDLFIATLVHDLKNPLLAQISSMDLLFKGYLGDLNNEQKELLETTLESASYMKEMLYTLINTYKYDNGNIVLKKTKTNIDNLIHTCIKEHLSLAKEKKIEMQFNSALTNEEKFLLIDEKQIRRVITNLLNNGINYAYPDTKFNIETRLKSDNIEIIMENYGPPIDKETQQHLFEKYISGANKYQKVGFGLGMYLSKKVMEAHGGTIKYIANNTLNSFILILPKNLELETGKIKW